MYKLFLISKNNLIVESINIKSFPTSLDKDLFVDFSKLCPCSIFFINKLKVSYITFNLYVLCNPSSILKSYKHSFPRSSAEIGFSETNAILGMYFLFITV